MRNSYGRGTLPTLIEQNKIKLKKQLKISEIILEDFIMIPFLGINLTQNPNNEQTNGNEFLIKKTPAKLTAEIQNQTAKLNDMAQKSQTSPVFSFIQYSTVTIFILIIASIFGAELSFVEEYHHTPWLYWFAAVFGIIGLSLSILSKRKSILFQRASEPLLSQLEDYLNDVDRILDVPDSAKEIDIFSFTYTITNNQIKIIKNAFPTYQFSNCIFKAYSDAENLYLAGLEGTYAFPLASITAIQTIKKRVRIMEWHKELPYNKGFYKQFHLSSDAYGCIHCNRYYIVELMHAEKSYGIYIPSYDISILEHLTRQKT